MPFAAVGSHDTASAVGDSGEEDFAFVLPARGRSLAMESEQPVKSRAVFDANFSNEGTAQAFRLLKNIMGLWLIQGAGVIGKSRALFGL